MRKDDAGRNFGRSARNIKSFQEDGRNFARDTREGRGSGGLHAETGAGQEARWGNHYFRTDIIT